MIDAALWPSSLELAPGMYMKLVMYSVISVQPVLQLGRILEWSSPIGVLNGNVHIFPRQTYECPRRPTCRFLELPANYHADESQRTRLMWAFAPDDLRVTQHSYIGRRVDAISARHETTQLSRN